jgi:hypothetical protein
MTLYIPAFWMGVIVTHVFWLVVGFIYSWRKNRKGEKNE